MLNSPCPSEASVDSSEASVDSSEASADSSEARWWTLPKERDTWTLQHDTLTHPMLRGTSTDAEA
ncbi:hypothetical protein HanIR_Chr15g0773981 [Helianthus annuus]|nr:hypothetical protein HanIR_Chr15g0773981 [Helianthus annuus]